MAVSELRSCYSTKCRFFRDDPRESDIAWYFVDEDTPDLPFGTIFTPNVWLDELEGTQDLGEVPGAPRTYRTGVAPWPAAGTSPCGTADQFAFGEALPPDPPTPMNVFGGPACCPLPEAPFTHNDCAACPSGAWSDYTLITQGGDPASAWGPALGTWNMRYDSSCLWRSPVFPIGVLGPHTWSFTAAQSPFVFRSFMERTSPGPMFWVGLSPLLQNCLQLVQVIRTGATPPTGAPSAVVILPGVASGIGRFCPAWGVFVPDHLVVRVVPAGIGIFDVILRQDSPFTRSGANTWSGDLLWLFRAQVLPIRFSLTTPAVLEATADGAIELRFRSPHGAAGSYESVIRPWDLSPVALMLQPGGPWPASLPLAVTLYVGSDLPP